MAISKPRPLEDELHGDHDVVIEKRGPGIDVATLGAVPMVDSDTHVTEAMP